MKKLDLRTKTEKSRAARHAAICREYAMMLAASPVTSPNRILTIIATRRGMSIPGLREIVKKAGIYKPRTTQKKL